MSAQFLHSQFLTGKIKKTNFIRRKSKRNFQNFSSKTHNFVNFESLAMISISINRTHFQLSKHIKMSKIDLV